MENIVSPEAAADALIRDLYLREYRDMRLFASRVLGSAELAEEAVQDTFVLALRKRESLRRSENPVGWLYNTLKHVMMHMERDRWRALRLHARLDSVPPEEAATEAAYGEIELRQSVREIENSDLVMELFVEQRPLREIAERHGLSVGACRMRIRRALEKMRKILD